MRNMIKTSLVISLTGMLIMCAGDGRAGGKDTRVRSAAALTAALSAATPGDTITAGEGLLDLSGEVEISLRGEPQYRIVIRAQETGKTELVGESRFLMRNAAFVTVQGFVFSGTQGPGIVLDGCQGTRVTRNTFGLRESEKSSWILVKGVSSSNRIDHCLFQNKHHLGNFITIEGTKSPVPQVSQHDTIDHNHFRDIGPRAENALEAIRIGSSDCSLSSGYTVLCRNLFERCDGDPEYVSIKSSDNIIRYNTFRECLGTLSMRHGNRNTVDGNFIIGNGRSGMYTDTSGNTWTLGTGGVRFCGDSMVIVNNYMEGLTGREWDAPLAIINGDADYGEEKPLTKHYRIRDAVVAYNTLVNNVSGLEIGYDGGGFQTNWWFYPPQGLTIANNVVVSTGDTVIRIFTPPLATTWAGNIVFASGAGRLPVQAENGVLVLDPRLVRKDGFLRPGPDSPANGAAQAIAYPVTRDLEGQLRMSPSDAGADQLSGEKPLNHPLTAKDVGPHSTE
jgi:poly(beta-D-mannuronate) lyase